MIGKNEEMVVLFDWKKCHMSSNGHMSSIIHENC